MKNPILCLLIDDDSDDCEIFQMALGKIKAPVECVNVHDAQKALHLLRRSTFKPDFIFLDLNMPRMSGKECLKHIKRMEKLKHVPLIVYSTSNIQKEIDEVYELGASFFITKPSELGILQEALADCFSTGRTWRTRVPVSA